MGGCRFPKRARLGRASEFRQVRESGETFHGRFMLIGVLRGIEPGASRIGLVTSRRVGGAVTRNRVRRKLREVVRTSRSRLAPGAWIVIVARARAADAPVADLEREWLRLTQQHGLWAS
jgi:ribonuclease P protein component